MENIIYVSDAEGLTAALKSTTGGETILLAAGNYGDLNLSEWNHLGRDYGNVTICSEDPENPAVFSGLYIGNTKNLAIDNVIYDYQFSEGDTTRTKPFQIASSENISLTNSLFDGDVASGVSEVDDGYPIAFGLNVVSSAGVTISGNEFQNWYRAAVFGGSDDLTVVGNDVHDIRSDGFDFVAIQGALIEGNYFHDFTASYSSGDHRDMIQFWTTNTNRPSTDIIITGNILDSGADSASQSIFMRNEVVDRGQYGEEMYYQNITITNNTIYNNHLNPHSPSKSLISLS